LRINIFLPKSGKNILSAADNQNWLEILVGVGQEIVVCCSSFSTSWQIFFGTGMRNDGYQLGR
jgi:hypothetical protein